MVVSESVRQSLIAVGSKFDTDMAADKVSEHQATSIPNLVGGCSSHFSSVQVNIVPMFAVVKVLELGCSLKAFIPSGVVVRPTPCVVRGPNFFVQTHMLLCLVFSTWLLSIRVAYALVAEVNWPEA